MQDAAVDRCRIGDEPVVEETGWRRQARALKGGRVAPAPVPNADRGIGGAAKHSDYNPS